MEKAVNRKLHKGELENIILKTVATVGIVGAALIAPNVAAAFDQLGLIPGKRQKEVVNVSRDRLLKRGLLTYRNGYVRLTKQGEKVLRTLELKNFALKKPKRWDGKWRVLIFDIPEYRRGIRKKLRTTLSMIGFVHLQHSVWLYPYDCEDLINLLKADFKIGSDVLYLVVEKLEYDAAYRSRFGLSQ